MLLTTTLSLLAGHAFATAVRPSVRTRQASAQAFATNQDLTYKLTSVDAPVVGPGSGGDSPWNLTIDDTEAGHKQTVAGFGGTVTDATVTVINALPSEARSQLLRELLTSDGENSADFSFLRHTIGASDLSGPPAYTYEDTEGGFGLGDRGTAMAKLLAEMKGIRSDAIVLGSAWSAPAYMKVNRVRSVAIQFPAYLGISFPKSNRLADNLFSATHRECRRQLARLAVLQQLRGLFRAVPASVRGPGGRRRRHHDPERAAEQPGGRPRDDGAVGGGSRAGDAGVRGTGASRRRGARQRGDLGVRPQHGRAVLPADRGRRGGRVRPGGGVALLPDGRGLECHQRLQGGEPGQEEPHDGVLDVAFDTVVPVLSQHCRSAAELGGGLGHVDAGDVDAVGRYLRTVHSGGLWDVPRSLRGG